MVHLIAPCSTPRQNEASLGAPCAAGVGSFAGGQVSAVMEEVASRLRQSPPQSHRVGLEPGNAWLLLHAAEDNYAPIA